MFNEKNIEFAKFMLAKTFAGGASRTIGVKDLFGWLKGYGLTRADLKEARKRMGILSRAQILVRFGCGQMRATREKSGNR